ncbi:MAG: prepilin-type N-terminal cleavage/methylation domain-containing protein, partial [Pseudomonadota bacterium]
MTNRRGFTLVDLMVALAILALVMAAVYGVFAFQDRALTAATRNREVYGQGLTIMDRLSRDLSGAWLPVTGLKSARIVYGFEAGSDHLNFVTTASLTPDLNPGPEVVEVGYRLESDPDLPDDRKKLLIRRQDDTPDEDPGAGGIEVILSHNVIS